MFDQAADHSLSLQTKLIHAYDAPAYVKTASHVEKIGHDSLASVAFVGSNRTLPVHTKAATWMSAAFLGHNAPLSCDFSNDPTFIKLADAANRWGIWPDVHALWEQQFSAKEPKEPVYALEFSENGQTKRAFPIRNVTELQKAAALCEENFKTLPVRNAKKMASTLLAQSHAFEIELDNEEFLQRLSGNAVFDASDFADQCEKRAGHLRRKSPETADSLVTLAKRAGALATDLEARDAAIELLAAVDNTFELDYAKYTELTPAALLQSHYTYKQAASALRDLVPLQNGVVFTSDTLHCLSVADYRDIFGDDFVKEAADILHPDRLDTNTLAAMVATLPRPDAAQLTDAIVARGGQPLEVSPSALGG